MLLSGVVFAAICTLVVFLQISNFTNSRPRTAMLPSSESSELKLHQKQADIMTSESPIQQLVNFSQNENLTQMDANSTIEAESAEDMINLLQESDDATLELAEVVPYIEGSMNFSVHELLRTTFPKPSHTTFRIQGIKCIFQSSTFSGKFRFLRYPTPTFSPSHLFPELLMFLRPLNLHPPPISASLPRPTTHPALRMPQAAAARHRRGGARPP
jgi:hypothetical protein